MKPERIIGRVTQAEVGLYGRVVSMEVSFEYADNSGQGFGRIVSKKLIYAFIRVFNVQTLSQTVGKSCWVEHTDQSILRLDPLFPQEGEALDFREADLDDCSGMVHGG